MSALRQHVENLPGSSSMPWKPGFSARCERARIEEVVARSRCRDQPKSTNPRCQWPDLSVPTIGVSLMLSTGSNSCITGICAATSWRDATHALLAWLTALPIARRSPARRLLAEIRRCSSRAQPRV